MRCGFCDQYWDEFWLQNEAFERACSNDDELFSRESDEGRALIQQAGAIEDENSEAAFRHYREAANAGSAWALKQVAWHYWTGTGVAEDLDQAEEYYRRAIAEGSWMATIHYARLIADLDRGDEAEKVLEDGVAADFTPAFYWLARLRYERDPSRKTARAVGPLLAKAVEAGHPGALAMLARMMLTGKFGLGAVPAGFVMAVKGARAYATRGEASEERE